jgi:hypothetical protein
LVKLLSDDGNEVRLELLVLDQLIEEVDALGNYCKLGLV